MAEYRGKTGVWAIWTYGNEGEDVRILVESAEKGAELADSYESIVFWPLGMTLKGAIEWFRLSPESAGPSLRSEDDNVIHLYYMHEELGQMSHPVCQDIDRSAVVSYDRAATGPACSECLKRLDLSIPASAT